jgi:hypothetical protein
VTSPLIFSCDFSSIYKLKKQQKYISARIAVVAKKKKGKYTSCKSSRSQYPSMVGIFDSK